LKNRSLGGLRNAAANGGLVSIMDISNPNG